ncbi:MAG: 4Fe-4S ferredoxin, partial [Thermodesulfobacteriota bacterium]|nr:4Fe-4S ferredoxin [Thermodesulfobacteriota bacterium]
MTNDIYEKLARHLDDLPGGFPATETGVEMRILRRLFTPEEAALAIHLTLMPKKARAIARRTGLPLEEASARLEGMAKKGLIFRMGKEGKPALYGAAQYVIGIWEYQVDKLDPELIADMNQYIPTLMNLETWKKAPQLRTIPVGRSLTVERD